MPIRDIRDDLRDRIGRLEDEADRLQRVLAELIEQRALCARLLEIEDAHFQRSLPSLETPPAEPLMEHLTQLLSRRPRTKEELIEMAVQSRHVPQDLAGRAVHATLLNMQRAGRIMAGPDGKFFRVPS
jgi:hypothetical protein